MQFLYKTALILLLSACSLLLQAQEDIAVGAWRTHLAYFNGKKVAVAPNKVYCASENGLFAFNTADNTLTTIGKLDGLSDNGIADLAYHTPTATLVIAYQNGNIDLLREEEIINVRSVLNSNRVDKRIFQITLDGNIAYMATAFGGLALRLDNIGIGDVYENLGGFASGGRQIALTNEHIYLLTNVGVFRVPRQAGVNPQDFGNWEQLANIPINTNHIAVQESILYYTVPSQGLFHYENGGSTVVNGLDLPVITFLASTEKGLAVGNEEGIWLYQNGNIQLLNNSLLLQAQDIAAQGETLWLADAQAGLVRVAGSDASNFIPTGTLTSEAFRLINAGRRIVAVSGGFDERLLTAYGQELGFYAFEKGQWRNFTSTENLIGATEIPEMADLSASAYDVIHQKIYVGSFGNGLLIWDLATDAFTTDNTGPQKITGLAVDSNGLLWATATDGGVYTYTDGNWQLNNAVNGAIGLLIDNFDAKWVRLSSGGLLLLNEAQTRTLRHEENQGGLRGERVRSLVTDQLGSVWAGTDNGITEFFDSFFVLDGEDGSTVFGEEGLPLHQGETVAAIAVDGGNRKWTGTENGGVWFYDADNRLIANFTTENSPLLSNNIRSIAIEPITGEVFFATAQGIISYRSTATAGRNTHGKVTVFPNPVRPEYEGLISISGLVNNAEIRITDTAGQVIWKGMAAGGTAVWDRRRFNGKRAKTGIYLVFSSSADGHETFVSKIAVIE